MLKQKWQQFQLIFFQKCCKLVKDGKPVHKPKYFFCKKYLKPEDWITYDYVEAIKKVDIKEGVRAECNSSQKCVSDTVLQSPDITFSTLDNGLKTYFECKILGSNSEYINKGIQRFINDKKYFSLGMTFYGMLGYVRDDKSAAVRYTKLKKSIEKKRNKINLTHQQVIESSNQQVIFETKHETINAKRSPNIEITHILHCWK